MCMAMGGIPQQAPAVVTPPPPVENTIAFDKKFNAQLAAKTPGADDIKRSNPLLAKSQRAALDAKTSADSQTGLQVA